MTMNLFDPEFGNSPYNNNTTTTPKNTKQSK
jgi:hypothetical protein